MTGRAMGDKGPVIQTWLELLPTGEYTSVVCGAMKLVFGVYPNLSLTLSDTNNQNEQLEWKH